MIAKISTTLIMFGLAIDAFLSNALGAGYYFNPFRVLFLFVTALVWFAWKPISEAFKSVKDESDIPIIRMGSKIIAGMATPPQKHRHSDEPA
jgi:hypothetical protein